MQWLRERPYFSFLYTPLATLESASPLSLSGRPSYISQKADIGYKVRGEGGASVAFLFRHRTSMVGASERSSAVFHMLAHINR